MATKKSNTSSNGQRSGGTKNQNQNEDSSSSNKSGNVITNLFGKSDNEKSLKEVFIKELKDIYSAEQQLIEALPEMADAAYNEDLQDAFNNHLEETKRHAKRLEKIFARIRTDKDGEKCEVMEGLIEEGNKIISEFDAGPIRDAALIIAGQKVEHYEIAAYGSLRSLADLMGLYQIADLLDRTLEEEEFADIILTEIAEDVNNDANEDVVEEEELEDVEQVR